MSGDMPEGGLVGFSQLRRGPGAHLLRQLDRAHRVHGHHRGLVPHPKARRALDRARDARLDRAAPDRDRLEIERQRLPEATRRDELAVGAHHRVASAKLEVQDMERQPEALREPVLHGGVDEIEHVREIEHSGGIAMRKADRLGEAEHEPL